MNKDMILNALELFAHNLVESQSDAKVDQVLGLLAKLIPGQLDDMAIAKYAPMIKAQIKAEALKQVDKINGRVG